MNHLALYQPDIPQNTGTLLRLGACLGVPIHIIEPCGFVFSNRHLQRAGMDYIDQVDMKRHISWSAFLAWRQTAGQRLVLLTPDAPVSYIEFAFRADDILLVGQESCGVPPEVAQQCDAHVSIPMRPGCRSLNVAISAAIVVGEALRQTRQGPILRE